jgi:ATP-dependent Zn protease
MYDTKALAYHEAGHAVGYVLVGIPFFYVSIVSNDDSYGHVSATGAFKFIVDAQPFSRSRFVTSTARGVVIAGLAGGVAEEIYLGHPPIEPSYIDIRNVEAIARQRSRRPEAWTQNLRRITRNAFRVPRVWNQVEIVATALLEKQTLTSREVFALLERDYPWEVYDQMHEDFVREVVAARKELEQQEMAEQESA